MLYSRGSLLLLAAGANGFVVPAPAGQLQSQPQPQLSAMRAQPASMMTSRRMAALMEEVDEDKFYTPEEAVALMKKCANAKFVETAELHGNLNLDPKYNDQQIRTTVALPHGTGNDVRVAVLADGAAAEAATAAGADLVGFDELIEDIAGGTLDFDVLLATPAAMPKLAKLGKVLGPKGLMPSPKAGTVSANPGEAVGEFKAGKIEFRTDKQGIVHVPFGKCNFDDDKLTENLMALTGTIEKVRPSGCKGKLWNTATLSSTMGPAIKLDLNLIK